MKFSDCKQLTPCTRLNKSKLHSQLGKQKNPASKASAPINKQHSNQRVTRSSNLQNNGSQNKNTCVRQKRAIKKASQKVICIKGLNKQNENIKIEDGSRKARTIRSKNHPLKSISKSKNTNYQNSPQKNNKRFKSQNTIKNKDSILLKTDLIDENDKLLTPKLQMECYSYHSKISNRSVSTNASSYSYFSCGSSSTKKAKIIKESKQISSVDISSKQSKEHNCAQDSQQIIQIEKKEDKIHETIQPQQKDYLDGYRIYQKHEKLFTFRIYKEDFLKIPTQYSKIILNAQDDDVSSDEDVVRGGVKINYKSILKEVFTESKISSAPTLNVHLIKFI